MYNVDFVTCMVYYAAKKDAKLFDQFSLTSLIKEMSLEVINLWFS